MLRVVIVDDEKPALDLLERMLGNRSDVEIVGKFQRPTDVLCHIGELKADVVYLDIEMPGVNGIELAMQIADKDNRVVFVFVTAYDRFALRAFNVNALDYILKPVSDDKLDRSIERVYKQKGWIKDKRDTESVPVNIMMLGGFVVKKREQEPIRWMTTKVEELFAYLLLHDFAVSKWVLMDRLWPDTEMQKAEQNLYTTIFRLKQTFKDYGLDFKIESEKKTYRLILPVNLCWDVKELRISLSSDDKESLQSAMKLYKGDLLAGKDYFWSYQKRQEISVVYLKLAYKLVGFCFQENRYREGLDIVEKVLKYALLNDEFIEELEGLQKLKVDRRLQRRIGMILEKCTSEELI